MGSIAAASEKTVSGTLLLGDVPTAVSLDAPLAGEWTPSFAPTDRPRLRVTLRAREALHESPRWFAAGPSELVGRGCHLHRRPEEGAEEVEGTCHPSPAAVRHAVRFATQPALLREGWLLVHACAVQRPDGVHVFAAPSGTGKTTFARHCAAAGLRVLADELVLMGLPGSAAHPAQPWCEPGSPVRTAALHFLVRGEPARRPLGPGEAAARLLSLAMVYERSAEASRRALELAGRLAQATPAFETAVPDDPRAVLVLEGGAE